MLYIRSVTGQSVALNAVARLTRVLAPLSVKHLGQLPAVAISFRLGAAPGDAVTAANRVAYSMLPAAINTGFQGTGQAFQASLRGPGMLSFMNILLI